MSFIINQFFTKTIKVRYLLQQNVKGLFRAVQTLNRPLDVLPLRHTITDDYGLSLVSKEMFVHPLKNRVSSFSLLPSCVLKLSKSYAVFLLQSALSCVLL